VLVDGHFPTPQLTLRRRSVLCPFPRAFLPDA
jgi:hypothetical protein